MYFKPANLFCAMPPALSVHKILAPCLLLDPEHFLTLHFTSHLNLDCPALDLLLRPCLGMDTSESPLGPGPHIVVSVRCLTLLIDTNSSSH